VFSNKKALLLDMNGTFMFGEDNFGPDEDFSKHYHNLGGLIDRETTNKIIRSIYSFLEKIYPDKQYQLNFPSIENTLEKITDIELSNHEKRLLINTFSHHEIGHVTDEYVEVLHELNNKYQLAVVIDIWSPKQAWISLFEDLGIDKLFSASSFSSDHGMVKPSPRPFELVIDKLNRASS